MKKILFIAPYFAPQTHAAVFRAHKLAKYLPDHGYEVHVVTVDTNYLYNEDPTLEEELPDNVFIHRARHIEPTLRGLRMAFGGSDRTFAANKEQPTSRVSQDSIEGSAHQPSIFRSMYNWLIRYTLSTPDSHWTWIAPATRLALRIIDKHQIGLMYTTANPFSVLRIGLDLANQRQLKWVADFRDPLGYGCRYMALDTRKRAVQDQLVQRTLRRADVLTGLSSVYATIFSDIYGIDCNAYKFIPTGLDDAYLKGLEPRNNNSMYFTIVFIGEFLKEYNPSYFFTLMKDVRTQKALKLKFIGRKEINEKLVRNYFSTQNEMDNLCEFVDHMSQKELYAEILNGEACLLLAGASRWYCSFAKMADYIALRKPVIAMVAEVSEARRELEKAGIGIFLEGNKDRDMGLITKLVAGEYLVNPTNYCKRYLVNSQIMEFNTVFHKLLDNTG